MTIWLPLPKESEVTTAVRTITEDEDRFLAGKRAAVFSGEPDVLIDLAQRLIKHIQGRLDWEQKKAATAEV